MPNTCGRAAAMIRAVLSTVALCLLLPAWSQAQGTGTVRGQVTRVEGGSPASGVSGPVRGGGAAAVARPDGA